MMTPTLPTGAGAPLHFSSHLWPAWGQLATLWPGSGIRGPGEGYTGPRRKLRDRSYWMSGRQILVKNSCPERKAERMQMGGWGCVQECPEPNRMRTPHQGYKRSDYFGASIRQYEAPIIFWRWRDKSRLLSSPNSIQKIEIGE